MSKRLITKQGGLAISLIGVAAIILAGIIIFAARAIQAAQPIYVTSPVAVGLAFTALAMGIIGAILAVTGLVIIAWKILSGPSKPIQEEPQ